jgi:hypothetical protein
MGARRRRLLRKCEARVRPGARAADNCPTPVEIRSTCARARAPNGLQGRALVRRLLGDYEEGLVVVKPGDTEGPASSPSGEGLRPSFLGPGLNRRHVRVSTRSGASTIT